MSGPERPPESLAVKAARGVAWTGAGQIVRQIIQIASQLALARLLAPEDFGLLGMALVFVGIGQLLADFGIGSAIVQSRTVTRMVLSTCFWLNLGVGAALMLIVAAASPWIGVFYGRADLAPLVAALSLNLLLSALQTVPSAMLSRELRFADLARAQVVGTACAAAGAIALAAAGAGVWALIVQPLFGTTMLVAMIWRATRWLPRLEFSYAEIRPLLRFSLALLGTNLVGYGNRNIDGLLIGRFLGASPLGVYAMAIQIMLFPLQQVSSVIVKVLFPTLSQLQDDLPRLRAAYLKAVSTIAIVTFPLMTGLFALADDFVAVLLGPTWAEMAPILKVLAWVGLLQSIGTTVGTIYLSRGRTDVALRVSLVCTPVIALGIAGGLPWGILGVAVGYACASASLLLYTLVEAFRLVDLSLRDFGRHLWRQFVLALAMAAVLMLLLSLLPGWHAMPRLALGAILGTCIYCLFNLAFNRTQLIDLWRIALSTRRPAPTRPSP